MGKDQYNSLQNLQAFCDDGNFEDFKRYCETVDIKKRQDIVQKKLPDGTTFLIAACKKGHINLVRYLIDECKADIEQVASVKFDGEQVEGVPPLWCASAAGHIEVVKLLVSRGAQVNRTTITNSTALRAACFDGHLDVVQYLVNKGADIEIPNRHGHTCLMISCYRGHANIVHFLLEHGARVNRQSAKGNTALHDCAESGNLEGLKLLLKYNAIMKEDEYGMTPIMAGANSGFKNIVEYLETNYVHKIPVKEVAMSYELLGANFLDRHSLPQEAKEAWRYALNLYAKSPLKKKPRLASIVVNDPLTDGGGVGSPLGVCSICCGNGKTSEMDWIDCDGDNPGSKLSEIMDFTSIEDKDCQSGCLEQQLLVTTEEEQCQCYHQREWRNYPIEPSPRLLRCSREALGAVAEFESESELEQLQADSDGMKLQTLLIRLRILGPDHPDTIYYIRYRGAIYADSGNIRRCLSLWMYALELQKIYLEPLCHVAQSAFLSFAELFSYILSENYVALPAVGLDPNLLIDCLELCVDSIERGIEFSFYRWRNKQNWSYTSADKDASNLFKQTSLCLIFMAMISHHYINGHSEHLKSLFTDEMLHRFRLQVYRLVRLDPRLYQGQTLLHLACSKETGQIGRFPICQFPNIQVVSLLLTADAPPNVSDAQGTTPLEMLAVALKKQAKEGLRDIMKLLVQRGAHLDVRHKSPAFKNYSNMGLFKFYQDNGINPVRYMSLACWCQMAIRQQQQQLHHHPCVRQQSTSTSALTFTPTVTSQQLPTSLVKFLDMHR